LINNINILKCATTEFNNVNFSTSLKLFIRRLFSSKRHALPKQDTPNENNSIRFGRKFELPKHHSVMAHLHTTHFLHCSLYRTCWKNNVQFSMYSSSSTAQNCDSCLLFKSEQNEMNCGFIAAIICDSKQECYVVIHSIYINRRDSFTFKKKYIVNPFVFWGQLTDPPDLVTIRIEDVIVKLAYNKDDNNFHFFKFPNTVEST
jgi:hypothetical protein